MIQEWCDEAYHYPHNFPEAKLRTKYGTFLTRKDLLAKWKRSCNDTKSSNSNGSKNDKTESKQDE